MPLIALAPHVRLAKALLDTAQQDVAWMPDAGVTFDTIRHMRDRFYTPDEKNALLLDWHGNVEHDEEGGGQYRNAFERVRRAEFSLLINLSRKAEDSGDDPTGWEQHGRVIALFLNAVRDPAGRVRQLCDWVIDGEEMPDEDSKPDEGRLVKAISVVYRCASDNPNKLFAVGEMG